MPTNWKTYEATGKSEIFCFYKYANANMIVRLLAAIVAAHPGVKFNYEG